MRTSSLRWLPGLLLAVCLAAPAARAQQKYRLANRAAAGDVADVSGQMSMVLKLHADAGGQAFDADLSDRQEEKYREEVLAVDDRGVPTAIRRTYSKRVETSKEPDKEEQTTVSALQGKTVEMRRDGDQVTVTVSNGKISDKDRQELADEMKSAGIAFFPNHEVAPGDDWDADPKVAALIFKVADKATIRCHFQDVVQRGGHPCAHIKVTMDASGKVAEAPFPLHMTGTIDVYHAIDLQRTLGVEWGGTASMKGEMTEQGVTVKLEAQGPIKATQTYSWSKVAGKVPGG